jgi:hypothetical protein
MQLALESEGKREEEWARSYLERYRLDLKIEHQQQQQQQQQQQHFQQMMSVKMMSMFGHNQNVSSTFAPGVTQIIPNSFTPIPSITPMPANINGNKNNDKDHNDNHSTEANEEEKYNEKNRSKLN